MSVKRNLKVLVLEPPNQQAPSDWARPNGALGPAYLVGALRSRGIEADYLDATVGTDPGMLASTFYNRVEEDDNTFRYGMSSEHLAETFAPYDVIATSSIFTAQTRMHFEVARIARQVAEQRDRLNRQFAELISSLAREHELLYRGQGGKGRGREPLEELPPQLRKPMSSVQEFAAAVLRLLEGGRGSSPPERETR